MTSRTRLRLFVLRVLVVSLLATLFGRLWYLQVMAGTTYQRAAADNQLRAVVTPAARGQILDDLGRPLALDRSALVVSVDRTALARQPDGGRTVLARLAKVLARPYREIVRRIQLCTAKVHAPCWNGSPYEPIPVDSKATDGMALQILENQELYPGVTAQVEGVRDYPQPDGASAAQLLGYLGPISQAQLARLPADQQAARRNDQIGVAGVEETYDNYLRGTDGVQQVAVDHLGNVTGVVHNTPAVSGDDLVTSINAQLQADAERAIAAAVADARHNALPATTAAAVVLDARTGHVLALASYPTYNPNLFVGGISVKDYAALTDPASGRPLLDQAMSAYAPGSTFKLISSSAALMDGDASPYGAYDCPSSMTIGGRTFFNNEGESGGVIPLNQALIMSCDTVFYGFGLTDYARDQAAVDRHQRPPEYEQRMAMAFGIGSPSGIDVPGEAPGFIETRELRYQNWVANRKNYCAGWHRRGRGTYLGELDYENCVSGFLWEPGDQANLQIGQGADLLTPLQLATAYSALINGGILYSPRVGAAVLSPTGKLVKRLNAPIRRRVPVDPAYLAYIEQALYGVTHDPTGTATGAFIGFPFNKVNVGGKTGTAEVFQGNTPLASTSWFVSFAGPAGQAPRYVAVVMVPHGGYGASRAAPAVRKIWDGLFGLEGQRAALPGGTDPRGLPRIAPDGSVLPPLGVPGGSARGGSAALALVLPVGLPLAVRFSAGRRRQ